MSAPTRCYSLVFPEEYDERAEWEHHAKGWLRGVIVRLESGREFPLFVYDPVRLAQDLEADSQQGRPFIAEHGLMVVPEVSREAIEIAVARLITEGFYFSPQAAHEAVQFNGSGKQQRAV